jgi:hypothetical protein
MTQNAPGQSPGAFSRSVAKCRGSASSRARHPDETEFGLWRDHAGTAPEAARIVSIGRVNHPS